MPPRLACGLGDLLLDTLLRAGIDWLGEVEGDVTALVRPLPADRLRAWLVDRRVNNVRNDGPALLKRHSVPG
jgi:putative SOS response-associated peptidase YedK